MFQSLVAICDYVWCTGTITLSEILGRKICRSFSWTLLVDLVGALAPMTFPSEKYSRES